MPTEQELISDIRRHWNPTANRAGRLVQKFHGFWHYSVALSNTSAISWGPAQQLRPYAQGCLSIHHLDQEFRDAIHVPYLSQDEILKNLIASVPAFHHQWQYGFQGWNCEHWARLVVSGQPISYQVQQEGFRLADACGVLHFRGEAISHLNHYKSQE